MGLTMENYSLASRIVEPLRDYAYSVGVAEVEKLAASDSPTTLLDLGTCDGESTVPFFQMCVDRLRSKGASGPIVLIFEDHPQNDWVPLMTRELDFGPSTFALASNASFFREVAPPSSVDFAFTNCAFHYLSGEPPVNLKHAVRHVSSTDPEECRAFAEAAASDYRGLLLSRARELKPGGVFVLSNFAWDKERDWHWGKSDRGASLYAELADCLRELVESGDVDEGSFLAATSPAYYRTLEEHTIPFQEESVMKAGLRLRSAELRHTRCPLRAEFANRGENFTTKDAEEYANTFTECFRSVTVWEVHRACRGGSDRETSAKAKLVDEVYSKFRDRVAKNPLAFAFDTVMAVLIIDKVI